MLSVTQAAEAMGVSRQRVQALIASGRMQAQRVGHYWAIDEREASRVRGEISQRPHGGRPRKGDKR